VIEEGLRHAAYVVKSSAYRVFAETQRVLIKSSGYICFRLYYNYILLYVHFSGLHYRPLLRLIVYRQLQWQRDSLVAVSHSLYSSILEGLTGPIPLFALAK